MGLNINLPWTAGRGGQNPTIVVPVSNRYSPVFPSTTEWQQLEFMKHACALHFPCFYIQEREKMSLLCSVCQAASSFVPKNALCLTKGPFLNYIPKGERDMRKSHFASKQYATPVWDMWPSDGEKWPKLTMQFPPELLHSGIWDGCLLHLHGPSPFTHQHWQKVSFWRPLQWAIQPKLNRK